MNIRYAILVNTCDGFEDCWQPFFKLFSTYWPDYDGKIYLNTEYKDFSYGGLNIIPVRGCEKHNFPKAKRAAWSLCLRWALEMVDTDIVLYMQEDYFLKDRVKNHAIDDFALLMTQHPDIDCIQLTLQAVEQGDKSNYERLNAVRKNRGDSSVVCCQASLWRKSALLNYIRDYESAWQFELFGSMRARFLPSSFLVVDKDWIERESEVIPYIFTGVIQGKWFKPVTQIFSDHNIEMDFSKRGFYQDEKPTLKGKIKFRIKNLPVELKFHREWLKAKLFAGRRKTKIS